MRPTTPEDILTWVNLIGKQVTKKSRKPFKSGAKVGTVTGIVLRPFKVRSPPHLAFTFSEDDSAVECFRCVEHGSSEDRVYHDDLGTPAGRFTALLEALEKRFPHPNPYDSAKTYEQYFVEWLDKKLKAEYTNYVAGWVWWDGTGDHPRGDTIVHYRMRGGDVCDFTNSRAGNIDWSHSGMNYDWEIIAYKVIDQ